MSVSVDADELSSRLQRMAQEVAPDELPTLIGALEAAKAVAYARLPRATPPTREPGPLLTAEDLAALYNTPKSLWYELARRGEVPCVQIGHYKRFRRADVDAWIAENSKTAALGTRKKRRRSGDLTEPATTLLPEHEAKLAGARHA